jgi:hypothetical protein
MHKVVKDKIEKLQQDIEMATLLNQDVELVSNLLPTAYIWLDDEVNVEFSVSSIDEVKQVLRIFAEKGIMLDSFVPSNTDPVWYLKGINSRIRFHPNWSTEEGNSCKLIKVGERTYTTPIYKLQCNGKEVTDESEEVNKADN